MVFLFKSNAYFERLYLQKHVYIILYFKDHSFPLLQILFSPFNILIFGCQCKDKKKLRWTILFGEFKIRLKIVENSWNINSTLDQRIVNNHTVKDFAMKVRAFKTTKWGAWLKWNHTKQLKGIKKNDILTIQVFWYLHQVGKS